MLVEGGKKQRGSRVRQLEALYKALIVAMGDQADRARLKLRYRGHVHVLYMQVLGRMRVSAIWSVVARANHRAAVLWLVLYSVVE